MLILNFIYAYKFKVKLFTVVLAIVVLKYIRNKYTKSK